MANTLQIKRGPSKSTMPALSLGELAFDYGSDGIYVGNGSTEIRAIMDTDFVGAGLMKRLGSESYTIAPDQDIIDIIQANELEMDAGNDIVAQTIRAKDSTGLKLENDAGALGLVVKDNGDIEVANSLIKSGGTSSQFLKADGSVDSNSYATETWVTNQGFLTSLPTHNHDSRYYTETEMDTKLSGKSDTGHSHTESDITDLGNYSVVGHSHSHFTDLGNPHEVELDDVIYLTGEMFRTNADCYNPSSFDTVSVPGACEFAVITLDFEPTTSVNVEFGNDARGSYLQILNETGMYDITYHMNVKFPNTYPSSYFIGILVNGVIRSATVTEKYGMDQFVQNVSFSKRLPLVIEDKVYISIWTDRVDPINVEISNTSVSIHPVLN